MTVVFWTHLLSRPLCYPVPALIQTTPIYYTYITALKKVFFLSFIGAAIKALSRDLISLYMKNEVFAYRIHRYEPMSCPLEVYLHSLE